MKGLKRLAFEGEEAVNGRPHGDGAGPHPDVARAGKRARDRLPAKGSGIPSRGQRRPLRLPGACSDALAKDAADICVWRPGFDRVRFHAGFNAHVVRFFEAQLR